MQHRILKEPQWVKRLATIGDHFSAASLVTTSEVVKVVRGSGGWKVQQEENQNQPEVGREWQKSSGNLGDS